jgi:hypothetical protein
MCAPKARGPSEQEKQLVATQVEESRLAKEMAQKEVSDAKAKAIENAIARSDSSVRSRTYSSTRDAVTKQGASSRKSLILSSLGLAPYNR